MTLSGAAQTNVHRVDGVLFVQWAKFMPHTALGQGQTNALYEAAQPGASGNLGHRGDRDVKVLNAINRLRDVGYLMRWPEDENAIWVFELPKGIKTLKEEKEKEKDKSVVWVLEHPKPAKAAVKDEKEIDYVKVLKECGFAKARAGSLRALDLKEALTVESDNRGNEFSSSEVIKAVEHLESRRIYQHFMAAITKTMLYSLAASMRYLPVTPNTILDTYAIPWDLSAFNALHLTSPASGMRLNTLDVRWFPSGTLVMSSSFSLKMIRPETPKSIHFLISRATHDPLQPLILAPFGLNAELEPGMQHVGTLTINSVLGEHSVDDGTSVLKKNRQNWFRSLVAILKYNGVRVPNDVQWAAVRVFMRYKNDKGEISASTGSEIVFWPASLCLIGEPVREKEDNNSWAWDDGESKASDPLAEAEAWYLGKDARERQLEALRRDKDREAKVKAGLDSDEKGPFRNELPTAQKFLDAQTASGIYPTPPDGQPFQTDSSAATTGEPNSTKPVDETNAVHGGTLAEEDPMHIDSTTANMQQLDAQSNDQDAMDEDDLFGGMNTGMFTATGLTEDDFNFFDEQDEPLKAELSSDPILSVVGIDVPSSPEAGGIKTEAEDWDMLAEASEKSFEQEGTLGTPPSTFQEILESNGEVVVESGQPAQNPQEKQPPINAQGRQSNRQAPKHDKLDAYGLPIMPNRADAIHGSETGLSTIDRKYAASGKYATVLGSKPVGERPGQLEKADLTLPYLDLLHKEPDSDESSDSEDEMSQSRSPSIVFEYPPRTTEQDSSTSPATPSLLKRKRSPSQSEVAEGSESEHMPHTSGERGNPLMINVSVQQIISSQPPSLREVLATLPRLGLNFVGRGREFINLAQLVTEQATLKSSFDDEEYMSFGQSVLDRSSAIDNASFEDPLRGVITRFFPHSKKIELCNSFSIVEQIITATHAPKMLPKQSNRLGEASKSIRRPNDRSESVFELPGPNILAQRADNLMELSSMALHFWEELGLAPCKGAKNVRAICVIPQSEPMCRAVSTFHDSISGTWQSMRFGSHTPLGNVDELSGGCLEVPFVSSGKEENYQRLAKACERLGKYICDSKVTETNIVIYMVNPYHPIKALPYLCRAFTRAKECCEDFADARDLHLVLKVIPLSLLAVQGTLALPPPSVYRQLARDVYDLSALLTPSPEPPALTPSSLVQLAGEIPKKLEFRLSADASSPLAHVDASYHVAYSFDQRGQWLAMALTDARGIWHWQASYNLDALASYVGVSDVFRDFWEITLDMIGSAKAYARVVITKDEAFSPFEINAWTSLASDPSTTPITLILVSLDLSPPLQLSPPTAPPNAKSRQQTMPSTPLTPSTPGPNTPNASGPLDSSSIDPSLRLISTEDQTWAVLNLQPIDLDPAVPVSGHGLLVMNAVSPDGAREGYRSMGVHVAHHSLPCATTALRDVLKAFKALGAVAKARDVMGSRGGLIPWHVAVAREARMALDLSMHWVEP